QPKVAFSATLSNLQSGYKFIGPFQEVVTLVYENAFTNVGSAYNPQTGTLLTLWNQDVPEDTASNAASLLLEKGDQVYVQLMKSWKVYTDYYKRNTFSGHLLYAM
ncbi:hypothetical protein NFI96_023067, partial [Prochilodus magdalenae]